MSLEYIKVGIKKQSFSQDHRNMDQMISIVCLKYIFNFQWKEADTHIEQRQKLIVNTVVQ